MSVKTTYIRYVKEIAKATTLHIQREHTRDNDPTNDDEAFNLWIKAIDKKHDLIAEMKEAGHTPVDFSLTTEEAEDYIVLQGMAEALRAIDIRGIEMSPYLRSVYKNIEGDLLEAAKRLKEKNGRILMIEDQVEIG